MGAHSLPPFPPLIYTKDPRKLLSFRPVRIFNSADSVDVLAGAAPDMVMNAQQDFPAEI